jgi:uncharacterized DUF497 family protein
MTFGWDDAERLGNLAKHGIDFLDARRLFDGRPVATARGPYPEEARDLTTGVVEERFVTVVWTRRSAAIRLIAARRARHAEARTSRARPGGGT